MWFMHEFYIILPFLMHDFKETINLPAYKPVNWDMWHKLLYMCVGDVGVRVYFYNFLHFFFFKSIFFFEKIGI